MTKLSVKKPFTVLVGIVLVIVLGVVAFTRMATDLLPNMELPYMIVYTTYPGASPEKVESSVSQPLEAALGSATDLEEIQSVSSENLSLVIMQFNQTSDMNAISIEVSNQLDQISGTLPDTCSQPVMMQLSPDMLPVMVAALDVDGMEGEELTKYLDEELRTTFERLDGVASMSTTGTVSDQVRVTLDQDKIDDLNNKVLRSVDSELADAKKQLDDAQAQIDSGKAQLNKAEAQIKSGSKNASTQLGSAAAEVDSATAQLNALLSQETTLKANQTAFESEQKAWKPYAEMNENVTSLAILISVYHVTGTLPDIGEIPEDGLTTEIVGALLSGITGISDALNNPASVLQGMTDKEFETARDAVISLVGSEADVSQMASVSRKDFITLLTTTQKAAQRVTEINGELSNIQTELATVKAMKPTLEKALKQAKEAYAKVEAAQMESTLEIASGTTEIAVTKSSLNDAQSKLDDAVKEFEDAREQAYKSADISGIITADMVSNILVAENFEMPAGYITSGDEKYTLKVGEQYRSLKQLRNTLLFHMDNDSIGDIRLKDVARVKYATKEDNEDSYALVNGNNAVLLSFSKTSTASTSEVSKLLNETIQQLEEENPKLHITPLMDQGEYIGLIVDSVLQNLLIGAALAVIVLLLFLRDVRPTVIIAFSIPLSVLFAIVLMYFTNITLNIISLSGLALGVGMLVDNSIVVVENIYRLRNLGMSPAKAAVRGAREVGGAITASTLTTICVFLPIVFTQGLARQLFADMGLTIAYSLTASLIVALTVVPSMSSGLLKNTEQKHNRRFERMLDQYQAGLKWCLRHRVVSLGVVLALFLVAVFQATRIGMEIIPEISTSGQMTATLSMPEGATKQETEAMVDKVSEIMENTEGVETVGTISGSSLSLMSATDDSIQFYILTGDNVDGNDVKREIDKKVKGLACDVSVSPSAMDMSAYLSSGVQIDIYGKDSEKLKQLASALAKQLETVEGLEDISDGNENPDMEKVLTVDKDVAMRKGLTVAQVYTSISDDLKEEVESTTLTVGEEELPVVVVKPSRVTTSNLMRQTVEATDAQSGEAKDIRLDDIATLSDSQSLSSITRVNNQRKISVTASVDEEHNIALVGRDIQKILDETTIPSGYTMEMTGENQSIQDSMHDLILMLILAVIFIYLIMVAQFQSLLSPFIVLFTMPLAFTGGLLALVITKTTLSMIAMLGFIILAGIVVNNGIVFVDCVNRLRLEGMTKYDALVAAGRMRMRPILMTALTTVLSMSIMALGNGSGAEMSQGMAIVIIGGLTYATVLTLIIVPIMYDLLFRRELKEIDVGDEPDFDEFDS